MLLVVALAARCSCALFRVLHACMSSSNRAAMAGGGGSAGTSKRGKMPPAHPCASIFFCLLLSAPGAPVSLALSLHSPLSLFSLSLLLTLVLFDSTEAEDMEVDGVAAVAAADGITDAVLAAGT